MLTRLLLRVLLLLGIAANLAFLAINLSPARPHLTPKRHLKILLRADAPRASWLQTNALAEFSANRDVVIDVETTDNFGATTARILAEKEHPTGLALASIDDESTDALRDAGAVRPMQAVAPPEDLAAVEEDYLPEALERAREKNVLWFLPKRAEVDTAIYSRAAVEDVFLHWESDRDAIDHALREANGFGLPRDYSPKRMPDDWDSYDLFVAGWYWAHHRGGPRIALRTGPNEDASRDLVELFFQHGITSEKLNHPEAPAVVDVLAWLALFHKHVLLAPGCDDPAGISSDGVNTLFRNGELAWTLINQEDAFDLHGGARRDAPPGIDDPADLGWATLPIGASLEMKNGRPARVGKSFALEEIHLWALPVHAPHPQLAWALARFLTQRGLQQRETEAQGLLPVRVDLQQEYPVLFRLDWMQRILDASYRQLARGSGDLPVDFDEDRFQKLFRRVVIDRSRALPVTTEAIRAAIAEVDHAH